MTPSRRPGAGVRQRIPPWGFCRRAPSKPPTGTRTACRARRQRTARRSSWTVVTNGVCDISIKLNWGDGDHTQPCGAYYPIIHITGNASLSGTGQGVLLIDGDLNLGGNFRWFGVLIVQGALKAAGGGGNKVDATVWGIALVRGGVDESQINGNMNFQYSKCGLTQALNGTSIVAMSRSRAWSQLY